MTPPTRRLLMTADAVGGVWTYATDLAAALLPHGWETVLAVLGPPPSAGQRRAALAAGATLFETGLPLDWLSDAPAPVLAAGDAVAAIAREQGADLVQLNQPSLAARARFGCPVVAVEHGCLGTWWDAVKREPLPEALGWGRMLVVEGLRAADRTVAPTMAHAEAVAAAYGVPVPTAVHNGRTLLPAMAGAPIAEAFTAGRLWDDAKDTGTLDMAAARLAVPFRAAGALRGPHDETVSPRHLLTSGALGAEDMAALLARRPVFVSAASFEPFGLAVLEAAAAGCALVLSDIPTFRELWDGAALFVPLRDDRAIAEAVDRLVADPALRRQLGEAARARAFTYTAERMAAGMAVLFDTLLPQHRVAA